MDDMNCAQCMYGLHAYLDNELDTAASLSIQAHLRTCAACASQLTQMQALRADVREHLPYYDAPAGLKKDVLAHINKISNPTPAAFALRPWILSASSAAFAVLATLYITASAPQDTLTDEIVASHVRSLQPGHLMDVVSSDKHTVKPWFSGKVDYAPPVYDFAAQGFPLLGGRLDYIDHRNVAVLSYQRNKHIINLYVMPTAGDNSAMVTQTKRGYSLITWRQGHLAFEAISDLNSKELRMLCDLTMSPPQ